MDNTFVNDPIARYYYLLDKDINITELIYNMDEILLADLLTQQPENIEIILLDCIELNDNPTLKKIKTIALNSAIQVWTFNMGQKLFDCFKKHRIDADFYKECLRWQLEEL